MLNQVVLIGRLTKAPKVYDNKGILTLKVPRPYKNSEGVYEDDLIPAIVTGPILENARNYLTVGSLVGVKGRIEADSGRTDGRIKLIVEKLTFLSNGTGNED